MEIFLPDSWVPLNKFDVTVQKVSNALDTTLLLILGESGVLLKCGGPRSSSGFGGGSSAVIWGSDFCAPCRVEKTFFKKKVFFPAALCLKKKVGLFPLKERFFGVPHFNAKFF